ncbi:MAG: RidA family protein [Brevibacillus sp.]|nr:RidA family protein [Brevibacillus sp.]
MNRKQVFTGSPWEQIVGYCRAIRIGDRIEVAGTTAMKDGEVVGVGNPYEQTKFILQTIEKALYELGADLSHVARTRMFVTDISKWEEIGKAHGEFFRDIQPVATMVEVKALIDPRLLVEIEVDAIVK